MTAIEKLYKDSLDLSEMLTLINDAVRSESIYKVDEWIISKCRNQITTEIGHAPFSYKQLSDQYYYMHNDLVSPDEKLINDLESIYLKALYDWGLNSGFIAFAYSRFNHRTFAIPQNKP